MVSLNYKQARSVLHEDRSSVQKIHAGKLHPVMATAFDFSEGGLVNQRVVIDMEPIAGRLITPFFAHVQQVLVPIQASHEVAYGAGTSSDNENAGSTEYMQRKLVEREEFFPLSDIADVDKLCGVHPIRIDGGQKTSTRLRCAHIAAVNHLRRSVYVDAVTMSYTGSDFWGKKVTNGLLSSTVLQRLNAVLDPDDRINGAVEFDTNITISDADKLYVQDLFYHGSDDDTPYDTSTQGVVGSNEKGATAVIDTANKPYVNAPDVSAEMESLNLRLSDFANAEFQDRLTRTMREMYENDPQHGAQKIIRAVHGLSMETGRECRTLYDRMHKVNMTYQQATDKDGFDSNVSRTTTGIEVDITTLVPKSLLGFDLLTFVTIKPMETLGYRPHPRYTRPYAARNFVADEMSLDPVPVTFREIDSDCDQSLENEIAFYMGENHLERYYESHGFTRNTDVTTVENKSAVWMLEIPKSVTPETVLYPDTLDQYPFANQLDEVATVTTFSRSTVHSPIIMGPSPVEKSLFIDEAGIFEDADDE